MPKPPTQKGLGSIVNDLARAPARGIQGEFRGLGGQSELAIYPKYFGDCGFDGHHIETIIRAKDMRTCVISVSDLK